MILTLISQKDLPLVLAGFSSSLRSDPLSQAAFHHIAATYSLLNQGVDLPEHRMAARSLCLQVGLSLCDEEPATSFSWDGMAVRTCTEASVLIHEVAHWLIAPPERRRLPDFGLGAGPETGRRAEADAAKSVSLEIEQEEESLASLLGILWEAELGQPAILAFAEQNWLEGYDRPGTAQHFLRILNGLRERGLIDAKAHPCLPHAHVIV